MRLEVIEDLLPPQWILGQAKRRDEDCVRGVQDESEEKSRADAIGA